MSIHPYENLVDKIFPTIQFAFIKNIISITTFELSADS